MPEATVVLPAPGRPMIRILRTAWTTVASNWSVSLGGRLALGFSEQHRRGDHAKGYDAHRCALCPGLEKSLVMPKKRFGDSIFRARELRRRPRRPELRVLG